MPATGWPPLTRTWCAMPSRPTRCRPLIPRLVTLCLRVPLRCSRLRRCASAGARRVGEPDGTRRPSRSRAAGGRGSSARRGAPNQGSGTSARRYGNCFGARERKGAGAAGAEPAICGAAVRESRTTRLSRAHRDDARPRDAHRSGLRGALPSRAQAAFFQRGRGDLIDLSGVGRSQILDALAAALAIPVLTEPHLIAFSPESYWKGETHRTCDRVGGGRAAARRARGGRSGTGRSSCARIADRSAPHRLSKPTGSLRSRVAEHIAAAETAVVRDAVALYKKRLQGAVSGSAGPQSRSVPSISKAHTTSARIGIRAWAS